MRKSVNLTVTAAPEPNDIKWENLEVNTKERRLRTFIISSIVCLILIISCVTLLSVSLLQKQLNKLYSDDYFLLQMVSFGFASLISLFNWVISKVMIKLTFYERNISYSDYQLSLAVKFLIFNFINTAPLPVAANYLSGNWDNKNILVTNALYTFMINSVFNPIYYLVNPFYWMKLVQRKMIEKNLKSNKNYLAGMDQGELN